ncbi:hypothetical protein Asi02nite_81100 [Asanoa siamensis]|uniref:Transposase n=1 Tax=Asanoa siamensis TaxID=926357 RepID=A0ABQ4D641_9ACTN|nr:hypothetical protein Asi02nite_81100 [Asanoa siamensis]
MDGKTNEITRFRPMLEQTGDLRDAVVTADALHEPFRRGGDGVGGLVRRRVGAPYRTTLR